MTFENLTGRAKYVKKKNVVDENWGSPSLPKVYLEIKAETLAKANKLSSTQLGHPSLFKVLLGIVFKSVHVCN